MVPFTVTWLPSLQRAYLHSITLTATAPCFPPLHRAYRHCIMLPPQHHAYLHCTMSTSTTTCLPPLHHAYLHFTMLASTTPCLSLHFSTALRLNPVHKSFSQCNMVANTAIKRRLDNVLTITIFQSINWKQKLHAVSLLFFPQLHGQLHTEKVSTHCHSIRTPQKQFANTMFYSSTTTTTTTTTTTFLGGSRFGNHPCGTLPHWPDQVSE